jgi:hypothetical protein
MSERMSERAEIGGLREALRLQAVSLCRLISRCCTLSFKQFTCACARACACACACACTCACAHTLAEIRANREFEETLCVVLCTLSSRIHIAHGAHVLHNILLNCSTPSTERMSSSLSESKISPSICSSSTLQHIKPNQAHQIKHIFVNDQHAARTIAHNTNL